MSARLRGASDLKRLGHGAEIRHQPGGHRGGNRHRRRGALGIKPAQFGASRRRRDRPEHGGRMPALAMQRHAFAHQKLGPHFVAGNIGRQHLGAARSADLALGEDRRHQHGAGMTVERHVVVVQHMGGNAVDQCRAFRRAPDAGRNERGERGAAGITKFAIDQSYLGIARAGNQDTEAIGDAGAGDGRALRRNLAQGQIGDEAAKVERESAHVLLRCGPPADPLYSAALSSVRRGGAELLEQRRLIRLGDRKMPLLDVAETADFFRDGGKTDREMMIVRRQTRQHLVEHRLVFADQRALGAAFERAAKRIERGAAQEFQLRQYAERRQQPRPETHLARQAGVLVAARQQRRRQMKLEAQIVAVEPCRRPVLKTRRRYKAAPLRIRPYRPSA